jgi:hypothetical protein
MFDGAIEAGIAIFLAHRGADDETLQAELERTGVEPWLARRLVLFLPIAFGRRLLAGATMTDMVSDGGVERRLDEEPVFVAAQLRAESAVREEIEAIGLRSCEVHAANAALNAGSELTDLVCSPVTLVQPLAPAGDGDGGVPSPRAVFGEMLAAHGHPVAEQLHVDGRVFPRLQGSSVSVQVDFSIAHPSLAMPRLVESFAGWATTWREAIAQAIGKFERSTVHTLIAGLLDRDACPDQVSWERVDHPGGAFAACLGGQLVLYAQEPVPNLGPLLDSIKRELGAVKLSRAVHALRLYVCFNQGAMVGREALLDNEAWPDGEALIEGYHWPHADHLWGSRLFLLLLPEP